MPRRLQRFHPSGQSHFVTFSCYHRLPSLSSAEAKQAVEAALERVRRSFKLCVFGYVVMPEHVHLLIGEPRRQTLAHAIKSLKQGVARRFIGGAEHFWQKRYYDFNVRNHPQFIKKLVRRETALHPSQSREAGLMRASRKLAVEQLPPLPDRNRRSGGDRVRRDSQPARTGSGTALSPSRVAPLKPTAGLNGPPADPYFGSYDFTNPQSMNRYAYVLNSPLSWLDPSGLVLCDWGPSDFGGEDFDDDSDCAADSGTVVQDQQSVSVTASGTDDGSIETGYTSVLVTIPSNAPSRDVPIGINIFNCPNSSGQDPCANTWKQSNCVVNKPFNTAKDDLVAGTAGAAFFGGISASGTGIGNTLKVATEFVGKEALGALALATTALHSITSTAYAVVNGCNDD